MKFKHEPASHLVKLSEISHNHDKYPDKLCEYQGYTYALLKNGTSLNTELRVEVGYIPLLNLKSMSIRAVDSAELVVPLTQLEPIRLARQV